MKILILGGTGNISTKITSILVDKKQHEIFLFHKSDKNIENTIGIFGDRNDYEDFKSKIKPLGKFDVVIDMIGYKPEDIICDIETFGGITKQFIFCSTVDVFTRPAKSYPVTENSEKNPISYFDYAFNKNICENLLQDAHNKGLFNLTILRPAATYNDESYPLPLIGHGNHLLKRIIDGKKIIVLGDGSSLWGSCHRDDVAKAFVQAIGNELTYGKSYNITSDETITWVDYYKTIADVLQAPPIKFAYIPTEFLVNSLKEDSKWCEVNFAKNNVFDNSLCKKDLSFTYTISWRKGVERMMNFHKKNNNIEKAEHDELYEQLVNNYNLCHDKFVSSINKIM